MSEQDKPAAEAAGDDYDAAWAAIDREETPAAADVPPEDVVADTAVDADHEEAPEDPKEDEDPWAAAPEALRTAYQEAVAEREKLQQRVKSDDGRVAAYQRRIRELEEAPKAKAEEPPEDDGLKALLEDYPDIGKPVADRLVRQDAEIAALREKLSAFDTRFASKDEAHWVAQEALLDQSHSDWRSVLSPENAPAFHAWLNLQDAAVKAAAQRNAENIEDAAGASMVVGRFKDFLTSIKQSSAPPPAQSNKRERQLAGATTVRTTGRSAFAPGIPEEGAYEDVWAAIDREERARAR